MRRGLPAAVALLVVGALACPLAEAAPGGKGRDAPGRAAWARDALEEAPPAAGFALLGGGAAGLLLAAAWVGRIAARPKERKPARRSFEAGWARGVRAGMGGADPSDALRSGGVGSAVVSPAPGGVRVALRRARGASCEHALGFVTGLFEGAWASDVRVGHVACAGRDRRAACVYEVTREGAIGLGGPGAGAWIRG